MTVGSSGATPHCRRRHRWRTVYADPELDSDAILVEVCTRCALRKPLVLEKPSTRVLDYGLVGLLALQGLYYWIIVPLGLQVTSGPRIPLDLGIRYVVTSGLGAGLCVGYALWIAVGASSWRHTNAWAAAVFGILIFSLLGLFGNVYQLLEVEFPNSFRHGLTGLDAMYVSVTTFTTVGSGSLTPDGQYARAAVSVESVMALFVVAVGLAQLLTRFVRAR